MYPVKFYIYIHGNIRQFTKFNYAMEYLNSVRGNKDVGRVDIALIGGRRQAQRFLLATNHGICTFKPIENGKIWICPSLFEEYE